MKNSITLILVVLILFISETNYSQAIIIDHNCSQLEPIPETAINNAKQTLHIAYGHTSHGSQLITGMTGLIGQTNLIGYKGDIYEWNEGGSDGALDIDDYFGSGDLGHNGDTTWAMPTRTYLANNGDVNVVIYSWCGGCSDNTYAGIQTYLDKMNELEQDYPDVQFVYMTGHTDIWADATLKANNQQIRDYCIANNKILYDFADIERYDPDGTYYEFVTDNCNYFSDGTGSNVLGNWALEWQDSHTEGIDWYSCSAAHSEPLNGNLKAYSSWWLWCRLAGWEGITNIENPDVKNDLYIYPNPVSDHFNIKYTVAEESFIKISIYDIRGRKIRTVINENQRSGDHQINFQSKNFSKGTYLIKMKIKNEIITKKIILF